MCYGRKPLMHAWVGVVISPTNVVENRKVRAELVGGHAPRSRPVVELVNSKNKLVI